MTDQDDLRDRIAAALYCHRYPREPMWGALAMARGEGMDAERGQTNCVQRIYVPMAQAIIDEFGLTVETSIDLGTLPEHLQGVWTDDPAFREWEAKHPRKTRIVGKWEKQ